MKLKEIKAEYRMSCLETSKVIEMDDICLMGELGDVYSVTSPTAQKFYDKQFAEIKKLGAMKDGQKRSDREFKGTFNDAENRPGNKKRA